MAKYKPGDRVGPWTLRAYLGSGGNADVWRAERDGEIVALKILRTRRTESEPFKRFKLESDIVHRLKPEGVVPVFDSFLPHALGSGERAWIAMPIAVPIREALGNNPDLEIVCRVAMEVAGTLAALGILAHRDIKPGNLYTLDGRFVIGDFGLVSYPGKEDLTGSAREVGPRNFLAPEMISHPGDVDGRPADVYSLAKTVWALATGEAAPPPGQFRRQDNVLRLGTFVDHPRIHQLEELLEDATATDSAARPSMAEFRDRLSYFLEGVPSGPSDVRDAAAMVRSAVTAIEAGIRDTTDPANKLVLYELGDALAPIIDALRDAGFENARLVNSDDILVFGGRDQSIEGEGGDQAWTGGRAVETTVKVFDNFPVFRMLSGIALEVDRADDVAILVASHARNLGTESELDSREIWGRHYWVATRRLRIQDRGVVSRAVEELSFELLDHLRPSLEEFADDIAQWRFNADTARKFDY